MKKFITVISLQVKTPLQKYLYIAEDNQKLQMTIPTSFPIVTAINGYVEEGEDFRVIALVSENPAAEKNYKELCEEIDKICIRKNVNCLNGIEKVYISDQQNVAEQISTFQKLIDLIADDDELFACITYGTKPISTAILMAVHYAYKLRKNTSISCIVYGEIKRIGTSEKDWKGYIYDMTALAQLYEIVNVLSNRKIEKPDLMISKIMDL